jgi:hypothetical protein
LELLSQLRFCGLVISERAVRDGGRCEQERGYDDSCFQWRTGSRRSLMPAKRCSQTCQILWIDANQSALRAVYVGDQ